MNVGLFTVQSSGGLRVRLGEGWAPKRRRPARVLVHPTVLPQSLARSRR